MTLNWFHDFSERSSLMDESVVMYALIICHPSATVEFLQQKWDDMGPCALIKYPLSVLCVERSFLALSVLRENCLSFEHGVF
jgi:hypothetical protein